LCVLILPLQARGDLWFLYEAAGQGGDRFTIPDVPRPANATTQWLDLAIDFNEYFASNPMEHIAVGFHGNDGYAPPHITGIGLAMGNLTLRPDGCPWQPAVVIERFTGCPQGGCLIEGPVLIPSSCGFLYDSLKARVILHATDTHMSYWVFDRTNGALISSGESEYANPNTSRSNGAWLGSTIFETAGMGYKVQYLYLGWF
jgi:hypothetical protein